MVAINTTFPITIVNEKEKQEEETTTTGTTKSNKKKDANNVDRSYKI